MSIRNRLKTLTARRRALAPRPFIMEFRDYETGTLFGRVGRELDPATGALVEVNEWPSREVKA